MSEDIGFDRQRVYAAEDAGTVHLFYKDFPRLAFCGRVLKRGAAQHAMLQFTADCADCNNTFVVLLTT